MKALFIGGPVDGELKALPYSKAPPTFTFPIVTGEIEDTMFYEENYKFVGFVDSLAVYVHDKIQDVLKFIVSKYYTEPLVKMEGELSIWDQEGGHCDCSVCINGEPFTSKVEEVLKTSDCRIPDKKFRIVFEEITDA